ncbi:MAG: FAD binding domain-containing protein, partial [FCB group bacterium]|nr:FAD binding domain-containing protein [FCB group bacterium]
ALYACGAVLKLSSVLGVRKISISEFITGPGKTTLKPGELLESISIPLSNERTEFFKLGLRQSMAISVVNFALRYHVENGSFRTLKIAVGSVAPTVVLLTAYSSAVLDTPTNISAALNKIEEDITPIDDIRATADYRRRVLKNVLEFTLKRAIGDSDV